MDQIELCIEKFLSYCTTRRKLSALSVRNYRYDMECFVRFLAGQMPSVTSCLQITKGVLDAYLDYLSGKYKVKTIKRKIACLRSFFNFLEYEEIVGINPFQKFHLNMREGIHLPTTMALTEVGLILKAAYEQDSRGPGEMFTRIRDAAILELLFAGGLRVSELCCLTFPDLDIDSGRLRIHGKGNKERIVYLENSEITQVLKEYLEIRSTLHIDLPFLFVTKFRGPMSTQGVRDLVTKYTKLAGISKNITPHVFRHSFASLMLEEGVDIKFIQDFLGHSSISTTQIYLHTTGEKKREIMSKMHPRRKLNSSLGVVPSDGGE
ncbi:MAG: tyrosine-type recombinase/integrase [Eubacteriales bacterium]|nr:tyrosine-type recombinase/integrase [Eubacteriales bacterium]